MPMSFEPSVGLLKKGILQKYDPSTKTITVSLDDESQFVNGYGKNAILSTSITVPLPLYYNNGLFIGTVPKAGTPVILGQGPSNTHYFVSFLVQDLTTVPEIKENELLIQSNVNTKIALNTKDDITLGGIKDKVHILTTVGNGKSLITTSFDNKYEFTQSGRSVSGLVRRERKGINTNYPNSNILKNDDYYNSLGIIAFDPSMAANFLSASTRKNPPYVENRSLTYEFAIDSNVDNDHIEIENYKSSSSNSTNKNINYNLPNRKIRRTDTLSLSLTSPNYLIEKVEGNVVDIFGNILDLNRTPIQIGERFNLSLNKDSSGDKSSTYSDIRALQRKGLAYHFEINARKDIAGSVGLPDYTSSKDYARDRSKFFLDIDKEGQFKLNVPASSEKGNIPLLTRYENYSTVGTEDNNNYNKLFYRDDNTDILLDSFAQVTNKYNLGQKVDNQKVTIKNNDIEASPIDRLTKEHIKYGTAHHDVLSTCYTHQDNSFINYQGTDFTVDISKLPILKNVVNPVISVGSKANAGGRSGSINFDGSLDLNIGANTVDRQSLIMDTAGGVVANIGRDNKNISAAISMDGQLLVQLGGQGIDKDSRFKDLDNGFVAGALDIRVVTSGGFATMVRIDDSGVTVMTPQRLVMHSNQDMVFRSNSRIYIEGEEVLINKRQVKKLPGTSI